VKNKFGRVGVLYGGPSSEREISLKSGKAVYQALLAAGQDVVYIDAVDLDSVKKDIEKEAITIAFIALHGRFGEDGTVQSLLEEVGIPYTGSGPEASRLALNKSLSRDVFREAEIPVPKSMVIKNRYSQKDILSKFYLPLVVKPVSEGSSIGMTIVEGSEDLGDSIERAFSYDEEVLIEEYIKGIDITVGILDNRPLPVIEIRPKAKFYDFQAKYTIGMTDYIVPAEFQKDIIQEAQRLAIMAHRALGCDCFSRVDMMLADKDERVVVLELNSIPGLTATSLLPKACESAGIDFAQMCLRMCESALVNV